MRLGLVSDIHGNLAALEAVVADIQRRGVDQIVCLGDNLSGPLLPRETAQYLMASGWLILAGNHERQILEFQPGKSGASDSYAHSQLSAVELDWLSSLKPGAVISSDIFVCHGTPRSDCEHFLESVRGDRLQVASSTELAERLGGVQAQLIACGHSHVPRSLRRTTGQLLVNPGSVGLQAYRDSHPTPYVVECGTPDAHYAIVEKRGEHWVASHHAVPYDSSEMAQLARARQSPDWERALLEGYVA